MQAVIMAGGKGTRLAALTKDEIPKPMVPVAGKPLLLWQVERLKENGITDLIMVIGHLGNKIKEYFGDGEQFGVSIRYFEETDKGTLAPGKQADLVILDRDPLAVPQEELRDIRVLETWKDGVPIFCREA